MTNQGILDTVLELVSNGKGFLVLGACICCVLTAVLKKVLCNKTVTDLTHSFDPCTVTPFIFGIGISAVIAVLFRQADGLADVAEIISNGLSMGALSTVIYHLWQSVDKSSLKQLCKDDLFNLFYNQLTAFTDIPQRLINGEVTIKEVIGEVSTLCANVKKIYQDDATDKQSAVATLMAGIFDDTTISALLPQLTQALNKYFTAASESKS